MQNGRNRQLHVFVHQNSNDGSITSSGAMLRVIGENGMIHKCHVPRKGIGNFWDAFSLDLRDLTISTRDRITPSEPSFQILTDTSTNDNLQTVMSASPAMGTLVKEMVMTSQEKSRSVLRAHEGFVSV